MERVTAPELVHGEEPEKAPARRAFRIFLSTRMQLILLILLLIIPIYAVILATTEQQKQQRQVQIKENLLQQARLVAAYQEQAFEGTRQLLISLSIAPQVQDIDPEKCGSYLAEVMSLSDDYALLAVANKAGDIICSSIPSADKVNVSDRQYFRQTIEHKRFSIGDYQVGRITKRPSIGLAYPVLDDMGELKQIVFATIDLRSFRQLASRINLEDESSLHLTVTDHQGTVLLKLPGEITWEGYSIADRSVFQSIEEMVEGSFEDLCLDPVSQCLYAFHRLSALPNAGYVIISTQVDAAFAPINQAIRFQLTGLSLVLLFAMLAAWAGGDYFLARTIRIIIKAMSQVKMGNLHVRTGLKASPGELYELASAFDSMADGLEQREKQLRSAEAARFASEMRLANIMQNAAEAIISVDPDGKIIVFNKGAERIFGYRSEEVLGEPLEMLMPEQTDEQHRSMLRSFPMAPGDSYKTIPVRNMLSWRRKSGQVFPGEASTGYMSEQGQEYYTIFLADTTLRQQVLHELQESRRALSTLLSNLPGMAYRARKNSESWTIEFASEGALALTGYTPKEVTDERFVSYHAIIHPDDRQQVIEALNQVQATGQGYRLTYRIRHISGKEKWVWEQGTLVDDNDGQGKVLEGLVMDITEQREAETKAEHQFKQLAALRAIDTAILGLLDLQLILNTLVDQVISQLQVDAAAVLLYQANLLEFAAGSGFHSRSKNRIQVGLGEGVIGQAAVQRRFIFCGSNGGECGCEQMNIAALQNEKFIACGAVPLVTKSELKGVLCVFHRSQLEVTEDWSNFLQALAGQASIAIENASLYQQSRRSNLELIMAYEETIEGWANALELRDQETEGHSRRVVEWTLRLAREMGIPEEDMVHIRRGAILHDIGKMGIPDSILLKNGSLTAEEWQKMRQHPVYAYGLLSSIPFLRPALDIPYSHHEHWDGQGYPNGLKGNEIPLAARIFAVIDVWDALRNDRPYHGRWQDAEVIHYLREQSGKLFDPLVVETFLNLLEKNPEI